MPRTGLRRSLLRLGIPVVFVAAIIVAMRAAADPKPPDTSAPQTGKEPVQPTGSPAERQRGETLLALQLQMRELQRRQLDLQAEQRNCRQEIISGCGLSPENLLPILLNLERERFALDLEVKLKEVRRRCLVEVTVAANARAKQRTESDTVLKHLAKLIEARQAAVEQLQATYKAGAGSGVDVQKAEADLADAQVRFDLRKEEVAKPQADIIERSEQQLQELGVEEVINASRRDTLDEKLAKLNRMRDVLDRYNQATDVLQPVNRAIMEVQMRTVQVQFGLPPAQ
jgi:hypothetical protein